MAEILSVKDPFINYRNENNEWWKEVEPTLKNIFPNGSIPVELKGHLVELVTLRSTEGASKLNDYMESHDALFDVPHFPEAVRTISDKMGAPLKEIPSDSWKK